MNGADLAELLRPHYAAPVSRIEAAAERALCEASLYEFLQAAWPHFDPMAFVGNWHLEAICEHLEAVTSGEIGRLLINVPPRHCLPADQSVQTEIGAVEIGQIVERRLRLRVPCWSQAKRTIELRDIIGWHSNAAANIYRLTFSDGTNIRCTENHRLLMPDGHWFAARDIPIGTAMPVVRTAEALGGRGPVSSSPDMMHVGQAQAIAIGQYLCILGTLADFYGLLGRQSGERVSEVERGTVLHRIRVVLRARSVAEIIQSVVAACAVEVARFHAGRFRSHKGQQNELMHRAAMCVTILLAAQRDDRIAALADSAFQGLAGPTIGDAIAADYDMAQASDVAPIRNLIPREAWNFSPSLIRLVSVSHCGFAPRTFCLDIRDNHNFIAGESKGIIVSNSKTSCVAIAWPCWTWALKSDPNNPRRGAGVRFLCSSYGARKAQQDAVTARRLIGSAWYRRMWPHVRIMRDRDNAEQYDTVDGGSRISTGIAESLGKGGLIRVCDDPHKTDEVESEDVRAAVVRAYDEVWSTRSNDPAEGAEVIIMQRLAERDISGHVLDKGGWTHLMLPAEHDPQRHCLTTLGWQDPRVAENEPLWPERFPPSELRKLEAKVGPYAWAGQYQQSPEQRGGSIVKRAWWQPWPPAGEEASWQYVEAMPDGRKVVRELFPNWDVVIASLDTAYSEDEENDPSALTVWGTFTDKVGRPRVMLAEAWQAYLELHPLVKRVIETCRRRKADILLIEAKASGKSVAQEVRRLMRDGEWQIVEIDPKGDKVARLHAVTPVLSGGVVYAPTRKWAAMVIDEMAAFPKAAGDHLTDLASQALGYMRRIGIAQLASEAQKESEDRLVFRGNRPSVADSYGVG